MAITLFFSSNDGKLKHDRVVHYSATAECQEYIETLKGIDKEIECEYVVDFLNMLIAYLPYYGPFEETSLIKYTIHPEATTLRMMILNDESLVAKGFIYLTDYGYATWRSDIQYPNTKQLYYLELTAKGRLFKQLGTISRCLAYESSEADSKNHQKTRDKYLFWIVLFGAIGTCISALYDGAQLFDFFGKHDLNWQKLSYFASGTLLGVLAVSLLWILKTISKRRSHP